MEKDKIDVKEMDLVFFDTELTGLDLKHEIVEIGFVKARAGTFEVIEEGVIKIKPVRLADANSEALAISGYNKPDWAEAVDLKTGLEQFLQHTEGCMLVGQNLAVDMMFLKKSLEECGLKPNYFYKGLDTFSLGWSKLRNNSKFKRFSLSEMSSHFQIDPGTQHRALDDARTTYRVFLKLLEF